MKIVFLDLDNIKNPLLNAGQARATREVGRLLALRHEVVVYCSKYPGYQDYTEEGITHIHMGLGSRNMRLNNLVYLLAILFLVPWINADIIVESFVPPWSVSFAPLLTTIPVVGLPSTFNAHEFSKKYHLPFHWIERFGSKFYKYFLPYSRELDDKMKNYNPDIVSVIVPEGINESFFRIKRKKSKFILFLGRLDIKQKGIDLLLMAYAKVADKIKWPLYIAGDGPDKNKVEKLVRELGLEEKVHLLGATYGEKKNMILSETLFVAFPSRNETFSLFALEALASGLPLVAFDIPGIRWTGDEAALKAGSYDVEEYSQLLLKATDESILESMRKKAKELAGTYSWNRVAEDFESFFYNVLSIESKLVNGSMVTDTHEKLKK
jgi:glycosyltransferase involved in cell wall biosynthesis